MHQVLSRTIRRSLMATVLVALFSSTLAADVNDVKPGDILEVNLNNDWRKCIVQLVTSRGRYIRVKVEGSGQIVNLPSTRYRELASAKPKPAVAANDGTPTANAGAFQTWTDTTGTFRIEAKFVELVSGVVKLQRKDGKSISVPLNKLSKADQDRVQAMMSADNPFAVDNDSPSPMPSSGERSSSSPRATGSATTLTPGGRVPVEVPATVLPKNISSARKVIPTRPAKSTYQPDPVAARQVADDPIGLPDKADFFEKITYFALDHESLLAVVSRNATFGSKKGFCEVDLVDLGSASLLNTLEFSANVNVLDVIGTSNSIRFATRSGGDGTRDAKRLDIWERTATGLIHFAGWHPYEGANSQIVFAGFVDPETIITINGGGDLVAWEVKTAKARYTLKAKKNPTPKFSPGRKYLVIGHQLGIAVMDARSGKFAAVVGDSSAGLNTACFSPDGSRLATLTIFKQLKLWDLSSGKMLDDIVLPSIFTTSFCWPDENHLLISNQYLYDLERRIVLWQYKGPSNNPPLTQIQDDQFIYVTTADNSRAIFPARIPESAALDRGKELDADKLLALKPGVKVSIRMQTNYTPSDERKAYEALEKKLQANGVEVVPSAMLVLTASSKKGETTSRSYRSFRGQESSHQVTQLLYALTLFEGRNNVWSTSGTGGPGFLVSPRGNESTAAAIRRLNQPSPAFFVSVKIPKLLARQAPGKIAYGASQMIFGGMKDALPDARK